MNHATANEFEDNVVKYVGEALETKSAKNDKSLGNFITKGVNDKGALVDGNSYVVSPYTNDLITQMAQEISVLRSVSSVQSLSSDNFDILVDNTYENAASWSGEDIQENTTTRKNIKAFDLFSQPKITQKTLEDISIDANEIMVRRIAENFARKENNAFLFGDGVNKPRGILTLPNGTDVNSIEQVSGNLDYASISNLISKLNQFFTIGSVFLMNPATEQILKDTKDNNGRYIYASATQQTAATIMGIPVVTTNEMPLPASGKIAVAYGNFKYGYQIIDSGNLSLIRDPFTEKPFVKFYASKKVGGGVADGRAIKLLKIA